MLEGLESWKLGLSLGLLTLALASACFKLHIGVFLLSQKRAKLLLDLLKDDSWRAAHPLRLQLACKQTFGRQMDDRDLLFILTRHDPLKLLLRRLRAGHFIRLSKEGKGFEDARSSPWFSFRTMERIVMLFSSIVTSAMLILCVYGWLKSWILGIGLIVEAAWLIWILISASLQMSAAHDLLRFEQQHPPVDFSLVVQKKPKKPTGKKNASNARRKDGTPSSTDKTLNELPTDAKQAA